MTQVVKTTALLVALAGIPSACVAQTASSPTISGTVTYRVRMALPPDAAIDVRLEDVSLADAPAKLVAENVFAVGGQQVPIPFQVPYSQHDIQANHRYSVRARITVGEKLLFTTTKAYPVITRGAPTTVNLVLEPVKGGSDAAASGSGATEHAAAEALRGTYWRLTELNGKAPAKAQGAKVAHLMLDASQDRYSASAGCNQMSGGFKLDGDSLSFTAGPMTMLACPEPLMTQERSFVTALHSVTGYRLQGKTLELLAGDKPVAKFKAGAATQSQP